MVIFSLFLSHQEARRKTLFLLFRLLFYCFVTLFEKSIFMANETSNIRWLVFMTDVLLTVLSGWIAFQLRFSFTVPTPWTPRIYPIIVWMSLSQTIFFLIFRTYRSPLILVEFEDIQKFIKALIAGIVFISVINVIYKYVISNSYQRLIPHSILVIGHFTTIFFVICSRIVFRNVYQYFYPHTLLKKITLNADFWEEKAELLLGRKPITMKNPELNRQLSGKTVLVTGAGGSIGRVLSQSIAFYPVKKLILLDQAESALYDIEMLLSRLYPEKNIEIVIADIRNGDRIETLFEKHRPDIVYHVAAYKHVPMMERNPLESVETNVLGTQTLADLSVKYGAEKFVFVSTDKAVNPTSIMGATKRLAEMYVQSLDTHGQGKSTRFITTRFGNVLGSDGSVFLLFQKQIAESGPVTVTHKDVTRYFMSIAEAGQLVLEAGAMGKGGEIFLFDMGEPVLIYDLAKKMVDIAELESGKTIAIKIIGLRPGEKCYEELLYDKERVQPTNHPKIKIAKVAEYPYLEVREIVQTIQKLARNQAVMEMIKQIKTVIPEYISNNSVFEVLDKKEER